MNEELSDETTEVMEGVNDEIFFAVHAKPLSLTCEIGIFPQDMGFGE